MILKRKGGWQPWPREWGTMASSHRNRPTAGIVDLADRRLTTIQPDPTGAGGVWAGGEPSMVWRSLDAGESWEETTPLDHLPPSHDWAFPPRPDTHHVRWIACHPHDPGRLWVAPLLRAGPGAGLFWAVDERGLHLSEDGGMRCSLVHAFASTPKEVRGLAVLRRG